MTDEAILYVCVKLMCRLMTLNLVLPSIVRNTSALNILKPSGFFTYHQDNLMIV